MILLAAITLLAAAAGPLTCGAVIRPGIAEPGEDGVWRGAAVNICHSVASGLHGAGAPIAFHSYDSLAALRAASKDGLAFLSQDELAQTGMHAGSIAAVARQVLAVPNASPLRSSGDLGDRTVCFIIGTRAESALDGWSTAAHVPIQRLAFQEPAEMHDAYEVGKCAAMAIDGADLRQERGSRALTPALAQIPIFVTTGKDDGLYQRAVAGALSARNRSRETGQDTPAATRRVPLPRSAASESISR